MSHCLREAHDGVGAPQFVNCSSVRYALITEGDNLEPTRFDVGFGVPILA